MDIYNFFTNREIEFIKIPFQEHQRLFNNFKNGIEKKMYINKSKKIKAILEIDQQIFNSIKSSSFFTLVIKNDWETFDTNQKEAIKIFNKLVDNSLKDVVSLLNKKEFTLIKNEFEDIVYMLKRSREYISRF